VQLFLGDRTYSNSAPFHVCCRNEGNPKEKEEAHGTGQRRKKKYHENQKVLHSHLSPHISGKKVEK
jgi:hypothetical protein